MPRIMAKRSSFIVFVAGTGAVIACMVLQVVAFRSSTWGEQDDGFLLRFILGTVTTGAIFGILKRTGMSVFGSVAIALFVPIYCYSRHLMTVGP